MAAGEYVSVSSQRDAEQADIRLEERELRSDPDGEMRELAEIYEERGLPRDLASEVAETLTRRGALRAHARDELGIEEVRKARPFQAAWTSALSFAAGAGLPLLAVAAVPKDARVVARVLVTLAGSPCWGAWEQARRSAAEASHDQVVAWGAVAMTITGYWGARRNRDIAPPKEAPRQLFVYTSFFAPSHR